MRVISIIVHLIALCDPALHKTTEEVAHPSLPNKRGVNFALLLSCSFLQVSLEAFYSIASILIASAAIPGTGMHRVFVILCLLVSIVLQIFRPTLISYLILLYSFCLWLFPLSPVLTDVPLPVRNWESPCGRTETVSLIPSLIEEKNKTGQGVGELGCLFPFLTPHPPPMGGQKATPSPAFIPSPTYPISLQAVCSQLSGS